MSENIEVKRLVFSIMKFLHNQRANHSGETLEQIEVAQQFLESAYGFTLDDSDAAAQLDVARDLLDIFVEAVGGAESEATTEDEETRKAKAEEKKAKGNELMKQEKYSEALAAYTEAISLHNKNAVYFCNRAASHSKLGNHQKAIDDCVSAIEIDPTYSKAFGRMGLAYSALGQHDEALKRYKRALELDPINESYKNNLRIAEEKNREGAPANPLGNSPLANLANMFGGGGGGPGGMPPGMPDMTSLLANPQLMTMATQMMQNPEVQNLMSSLMTGAAGGPEAGNMDHLLRAGHDLAQQLHSTNPELVDQLRQMGAGAGAGAAGQDEEADEEGDKDKAS